MTREAIWFGPEDEPLFGWLHYPDDGPVRASVVICPPVGEEYKASHYTIRALAEGLESEGYAVLRFDYRGTGDSSGQPPLRGWAGAMVADVRTAIDFVCSEGMGSVVVVGMRMGATLAASALREGPPVEGLVLWDPCASARSFLREQVLLRSATTRDDALVAPDGWIDGPEMLFPADFALELPTPDDLPQAKRTLVLPRIDRAVSRNVRVLAEALGAEERPALGQTELLEVPSIYRSVPSLALVSITSWIATLPVSDPPPALVRPEGRPRALVERGDGCRVIEHPMSIGDHSLFGIVTEPVGGPAPGLPAVLLLSVANDHRAATGRLWVDLSRRLAAVGFRSLRLDLSGMGDSSPRPGQPAQVIGAIAHFDDVSDAALALSGEDASNNVAPSGDANNIVVVGLSSSAYLSLETGRELRARIVCAINPNLHFAPPESAQGGVVDGRRRFCFPPPVAWANVRGRSWASVVKKTFPNLSWRVAHLLASGSLPLRRLADLVDAGTHLLLVGGARETLILRQSSPRLYDKVCRTPGSRVVAVANLEHHLPGYANRRQVFDLIEQFITEQCPQPGLARPGLARPGLAQPALARPALAEPALAQVSP